ncbi:MAG TPA: hypothetical protein VFE47_25015 [Tepidisphaeraceae bacterium]|jgi:hypothetical protein|nr:hypothetical protein [Tepidisphaeraceae bacterium]
MIHRFKHSKHFGVAGLLCVGLLAFHCARADDAKPATHPVPAMPAHVFAAGSFWYQPIPNNAPLHRNSANFVAEFLRQKKAYYGTVTINTTAYAAPVYVVGPDVKPVTVTEWDGQHKGYKDKALAGQWKAVPIPDYAAQADGTDAEMCIYQPATDSMWEFWQTRKVDGQWQAVWGGGMHDASKNPGIWENHYGTTATSLPFIGGQITPAELSAGEIKHVMGISLVDQEKWSIFSWPATRSDGYNPKNAPNRIPEGLRFRLDPSVNVDELKMHPVGKIIARAAQKYGFVIWDKAGAISLRAENPKSYTQRGEADPYPKLFAGKPAYAILEGFPWEKLQFLPMDYGKPAGK